MGIRTTFPFTQVNERQLRAGSGERQVTAAAAAATAISMVIPLKLNTKCRNVGNVYCCRTGIQFPIWIICHNWIRQTLCIYSISIAFARVPTACVGCAIDDCRAASRLFVTGPKPYAHKYANQIILLSLFTAEGTSSRFFFPVFPEPPFQMAFVFSPIHAIYLMVELDLQTHNKMGSYHHEREREWRRIEDTNRVLCWCCWR